MKKYVLLLALLVASLAGFGQSPGKLVRVATRTTAFGTNLPAGTQVYCVADSTLWVVQSAGVASTRTINTAWSASPTELVWMNKTKLETTRDNDQVNLIIDSLKADESTIVVQAATTTYAGVMTATDKTKLDGISSGSGVMTSEYFEAASDASSGTQVTLANTPKDSVGVNVSLNGAELKLTTHFYCGTLSVKKITFKIPVYKYDGIHVQYNK